MNAQIIGLSEDFSFALGESTHYVTLGVPGMPAFRAVISAEISEKLVQVFADQQREGPVGHPALRGATGGVAKVGSEVEVRHPVGGFPMADPADVVAGDHSPAMPLDDDGNVVFGGAAEPPGDFEIQNSLDAAAAAAGDMTSLLQQPPAAAAQQLQRGMPTPQWNNTRSPDTNVRVSASSNGYPVLSGSGIRDPHDVMGGVVEDGDVGQL